MREKPYHYPSLILTILLIAFVQQTLMAQCETIANGNWESPATWGNCGGGIPTSTSAVNIRHDVTLSTDYTVASVTFSNNGAATRSLTINNGTLTVTGNYTHNSVGGGPTTTVGTYGNLVVGGTLVSNTNITVNGNLTVSTLNPQGGIFTIGSTGEVVVTNNLTLNSGPLDFDVFGALTVAGNTLVTDNTRFNLRSGGEANLAGNLNLNGGSIATVEDTALLQVGQNLSIGGGADITPMNGNINVLNQLSFENNGNNIIGSNRGCIYFGSIACPQFLIDNHGSCQAPAAGLITGVCILDAPILLPVQWLFFRVTLSNGNTMLEWATAQEVNHQHFTVERAADGFLFHSLGIVPGQGDRHTITNYWFTDSNPLPGTNYYRIRQTDFDGTESFSNIVQVNNQTQRTSGFLAGPNPLVEGHEIWIEGQLPQAGEVTVTLFSLSGQLVFRQRYTQPEGTFRLTIPTSVLEKVRHSPLLFVQYQTGQTMHRQKILMK